jgi:hypothetical protein
MRKLRTWLLERLLPAWAKDSVYRENMELLARLERQEQEIQRLIAYIDGLETGLRAVRRVVIQTGGVP